MPRTTVLFGTETKEFPSCCCGRDVAGRALGDCTGYSTSVASWEGPVPCVPGRSHRQHLSILQGAVILVTQCFQIHSRKRWVRFLGRIWKSVSWPRQSRDPHFPGEEMGRGEEMTARGHRTAGPELGPQQGES